MHKTVAEAEAFIAALLPRVATADAVDVAICPPFLALGAMVDSTRGSRVEVYAQNMHARPGRLHRRDLAGDARASSTCTAWSSATPSGASCSARPTARCS